MKIIRVGENTTVFFSDGTSVQKSISDLEFDEIFNMSEEELKAYMFPKYKEDLEEYNNFKFIEDSIEDSKLLEKKGDSIYWKGVSELSMPMELVKEVLDAEFTGNESRLNAYRNFWVLMSLNPDSRCRQNLFWFLKKYGMTISEYGLFVGYRNADVKQKGLEGERYSKELISFVKESYDKVKHQKQSPKRYQVITSNPNVLTLYKCPGMCENVMSLYSLYIYFNERNWDYDLINPHIDTVYTDHHSHTFTIKIGEKVSMNRADCDSKQENTCSRGLHIGGASWLEQNYFGDAGLICLINPADVVAVPPYDNYGKLRTCAYLPIGTIKFDSNGHVIPYNLEDGFKSEYVKEVIYDGIKNGEDEALYTLNITNIPELNLEVVSKNLFNIAQQAIKDKVQ